MFSFDIFVNGVGGLVPEVKLLQMEAEAPVLGDVDHGLNLGGDRLHDPDGQDEVGVFLLHQR